MPEKTIKEKMEPLTVEERQALIGRFAIMSIGTNAPKSMWLPKLTQMCRVYDELEK